MKIDAMASMEEGGPVQPWDFEAPKIEAGEVLLRVICSGVCHSDIHQLANAWKVAKYPLVVGHEIIGEVLELGEGVDRVTVGMRVGIGPQRSSCAACDQCDAKFEQRCAKIQKTYGGDLRGGFASHMVFPAQWCFPVPDAIPSEYAPLLCAGITTYWPLSQHATKDGGLKVGVVGVGGLGHLGIQYAAKMGNEVTAISRSPAKEAEARGFGADKFLVSTDPEAMKAADRTLDFILCTSSAKCDWSGYMKLLKPAGAFVTVGLPPVEDPFTFEAFPLILRELSFKGSYLGSHAAYTEMLEFSAKHGVAPQVEVVPFAEAEAACQKVRENKARYRMVLRL